MRLWSLHPKYLDPKGIVALWREGLLAKKVLEGKTRGYRNHPQLKRFRESGKALEAVNQYLANVYAESQERGYHFDRGKVNLEYPAVKIPVTDGQVEYEIRHLLQKLKQRDPKQYQILSKEKNIEVHPLFIVRQGGIEDWEII
jgi:hypothetical protein